mmetsp:Transcript_12109/g.10727  ORF Transcript_12109/g.10727 Transcript_12109/m.10727 type:complete len:180 (+) Transcript_12109:605-1144(+)
MNMLQKNKNKYTDQGPKKSINNVFYVNGNNYKDKESMKSIKEEIKQGSMQRKKINGMASPSPSEGQLKALEATELPRTPSHALSNNFSVDEMSEYSISKLELGALQQANKLVMTNRELSAISDYEQIHSNPGTSAFHANVYLEGEDRPLLKEVEDRPILKEVEDRQIMDVKFHLGNKIK